MKKIKKEKEALKLSQPTIFKDAKKQKEEDSIGELTDLEKNDILTDYYNTVMTKYEKKQAQREKAKNRLYKKKGCLHNHNLVCADCLKEKKKTAAKKMIRLEMREAEQGREVADEEISAHQFSNYEAACGRSEAPMEKEMQTS